MQWMLLGYMFLFIHRPFEVWPILGEIHLERLYMFATLAAWAVYPRKRWLSNPLHGAYIAFAVAIVLCWLLSPWMAYGENKILDYFKIWVFYLLVVTVVHDEKMLKQMLLGFLVVMFIYMAHSLFEFTQGRVQYRMGTPRMVGVDSSMGDPNTFGASIIYALPFVVPFWRAHTTTTLRAFLAAYVGLTTLCILLTGSRSSLMALVVCAVALIAQSKYRWRWLAAAVGVAPLLFFALPPALQNRFTTIIDPSVGPANAQESGEGRITGLINGWKFLNDYPLSGIGPGAWQPATKGALESHSLYGQLMGETGLLGMSTFMAVMCGIAWNIWRARRLALRKQLAPSAFLYQLPWAVGLSIGLLLMLGFAGHNMLRYSWLWNGGWLIIGVYCLQHYHGTQPSRYAVYDYRVRYSLPTPHGHAQRG
jgi:O-antigen ligase